MKGQTALEYLMTYGWALLIIVVVGAALYALGVFNPATYATEGCRGFGYFQYSDIKIAAGQIDLQVVTPSQAVTIDSIIIDKAGTPTTLTVTAPSGEQSIGKQFTITATGTVGTVGDSFSKTITVVYNVTGGIQLKEDTATCTGTIV